MSIPSAYPQPEKLWKTPVEKPVENVEKWQLSTGIPSFAKSAPTCGKMCISDCITPRSRAAAACYVTGNQIVFPVKSSGKSLIL